MNWHGHNEDQWYLEAMLFNISEAYGWQTWNSFFRIAKQSGMPKISPDNQMKMEDLTQREASLAFSRFVYLLSLAAGGDLRPQFEAWDFRIAPEVRSMKIDKIKEKPIIVLTLSSNSVNTGDVLNIGAELKDMRGVPIANETLDFFMQASDGSVLSLGRASTNGDGQAEVSYRANVDVGIYRVIASYEGSLSFLRTSRGSQVVVNPLAWKLLPDGRLDLVDELGTIAGDLGQRYVDLADLNYSFSSNSLYFRFTLHDKIPKRATDSRVESIWYQVLFNIDSDSTGFHWSRDFTPDYILQLCIRFDTLSKWVESYVLKYSGKGEDWSWTSIHETERFGSDAALDGGIGHVFFTLTCEYRDISVSKGSTIRFFGRSGILYDGKVYNDPIPDTGTISLTLLPITVSTIATSVLTRITSETAEVAEVQTEYLPCAVTGGVVVIVLIIGLIVVRNLRKKRKEAIEKAVLIARNCGR